MTKEKLIAKVAEVSVVVEELSENVKNDRYEDGKVSLAEVQEMLESIEDRIAVFAEFQYFKDRISQLEREKEELAAKLEEYENAGEDVETV